MQLESEIPKSHPRYASLVTRQKLAEMMSRGIVHPTGLIAHGRGEAFDYLMGERSQHFSESAERAAAQMLLNAHHPVITVNGNVAALCPGKVVRLASIVGAKIEINLFHRTEERVRCIEKMLKDEGADAVLKDGGFRIPGIESRRSIASTEGTAKADVMLIPLEDGDRAEALVALGKKVISVDLNPLSRTSNKASISIIDEVSRAFDNMILFSERKDTIQEFDNRKNLAEAVRFMAERLVEIAEELKTQ